MRRSRFSDQQIALALQQAQHGAPVDEVCRKLGISEQTFYRWSKKFGEMAPREIKEMKQLEDENRRLKQLVADLTLDKQMLCPAHDSGPAVVLGISPDHQAATRS
jgi:putative transposase